MDTASAEAAHAVNIAPSLAAAPARRPPRFNRVLTWCLAAVLLAAMAALWLPPAFSDRTGGLHYPAESAARLSERHLEFWTGMREVAPWEAGLYRWLYGDRVEALTEAAATYRDVLRYFAAHPSRAADWSVSNTRARLALVLMEEGRFDEARVELRKMDDSPTDSVVADAIRYAYGLGAADVSRAEIAAGLRQLPVGWATDTLTRRLAAREGAERRLQAVERRQLARAEHSRDNTLLFVGLTAALMAGGVFGLASYVRGRSSPAAGSVLTTPWAFHDGVAVLVRSGLLGIAIFVVLSAFDTFFSANPLSQWSTLLASIPMVWMIRRQLLLPRGLGLLDGFGLRLRRAGILRVLGLTLMVLLIERSGALAISWGVWKAGIEPHWADGLAERWIWGPWDVTLLSSINTVVWAPIFEEIGFRGLLYTTLRSRYGVVTAAILSAAIFAMLHLYSIAGALAVFWSGLVWAFAFERFRSLLPAMFAHATGNLMAVASVLLFYR